MQDTYGILVPELINDSLAVGYSSMSDEEILSALNSKNRTKIISKFGSFRTLANILDDASYTEVKGILTAASAMSEKIADMLKMLNLPGDEQGNGGGIDLGSASARAAVDLLFSPTIAATIKAYAEVNQSRLEELGLSQIELAHISCAKSMIPAPAPVEEENI